MAKICFLRSIFRNNKDDDAVAFSVPPSHWFFLLFDSDGPFLMRIHAFLERYGYINFGVYRRIKPLPVNKIGRVIVIGAGMSGMFRMMTDKERVRLLQGISISSAVLCLGTRT